MLERAGRFSLAGAVAGLLLCGVLRLIGAGTAADAAAVAGWVAALGGSGALVAARPPRP